MNDRLVHLERALRQWFLPTLLLGVVGLEGLGVERDGKSAKPIAKPAKSGRLDFLKKVFV